MYTRNAVDLHSESFRALPGRTLAGKTGAKKLKRLSISLSEGQKKKKRKKVLVYNTAVR